MITWILGFLTLAGVNFSIWGTVGLVRFVAEKSSPMVLFKFDGHYAKRGSALFWIGKLGIVTVLAASAGSFVLLTIFLATTGISAETPLLVQEAARTVVILLMGSWMFFSGLASYLANRIDRGKYVSISILTGLSLWLILISVLFSYELNAVDLSLQDLGSLLLLLVAALIASVSSGFLARAVASEEEHMIQIEKSELLTEAQVAALVPAHNEEHTIQETLEALKRILPSSNIFVASDGSSDKTVEISKKEGVNLVDINPNRGKAGALMYAINFFDLNKRFEVVLIVDADTKLDQSYLRNGLKLFKDPGVVAVAGHAITCWEDHSVPKWSLFFTAYRVRLYRILQAIFRYGQTWKYSSVTTIIPGFASMYRTSALSRIAIDAPGLVIEDFNMTFEIHHKRLGRVAYSPSVLAASHDPITFSDYVKQVRRWNLGFWQTVRRHGIWPSLFWLSLSGFLVELIAFGLVFLAVPLLLLAILFGGVDALSLAIIPGTNIELTALDILLGILLADYLLTFITAVIEKKPMLLFYGLGFFILRYIDTVIFLSTLPAAFFISSDGKWKSPTRPIS